MKRKLRKLISTILALTMCVSMLPSIDVSAAQGSSPAKIVADNHNLMLRADGRLFVWGDNTYGQLGLGAGALSTICEPTENNFFADNDLRIKDICVVEDASFVLCTNGDLYSTGKGLNGRLGLGSTSNKNTWTLVEGSRSLYIDRLYSGKEFVVAVNGNNELYAWGRNDYGQIGNGSKADVTSPVKVMSNADVKHLTVGGDFVVLIKTDNSVWLWGNNNNGQFPFDARYVVKDVQNIEGQYTASGYKFTSIVGYPPSAVENCPADGDIKTINIPKEALTPSKLGTSPLLPAFPSYEITSQLVESATYTSSSSSHTYKAENTSGNRIIVGSSSPLVFSYTDLSQLNYSDAYIRWDLAASTTSDSTKEKRYLYMETSWKETPKLLAMSVASNVAKITDMQTGLKHGYFLFDGKYYSFGDNALKQQSNDYVAGGSLSDAAAINNFISTLKSGEGFSSLIVAGDTNYIISGNGNVYAWGSNSQGKAGIGSVSASVADPTKLNALNGKSIASVVSGRNHILFIGHNGDVYVSGDNLFGQLGLGPSRSGDGKLTTPELVSAFKFSSDGGGVPDTPVIEIGVTEVEAGKAFTITWNDVGAVKYIVERHFTPTAPPSVKTTTVIYEGANTYATDTIPEAGTASYTVKAVGQFGDVSAGKSNTEIIVNPSGDGGGDDDGSGGDSGNSNTEYTVTVSGGAGGGKYKQGDTVFITADPPPDGKVFDRWTASGVIISNPQSETAGFIMPNNNVIVTAVYKNQQYTATVSGGTGSGSYTAGSIVYITASAAPSGKVFDRWVGGVAFTDAENPNTAFTMPENHVTITAVYKEKSYTLTVSGGTGGGSFSEGNIVYITANPAAAGKVFDCWTVTSGGGSFINQESPSTAFIMPGSNAVVTATYKDKLYSVTVSGGTGSGSYKEGATVSIAAFAASGGNEFDRWTSTGGVVFSNPQAEFTTFTMPAEDVFVSASYTGKTYSASVSGGSGSGSYGEGAIVTITANPPSEGQIFDRWTSNDGISFANPLSESTVFFMPAKNVIVTASYKDKLYGVSVLNGSGSGEYKQGDTVWLSADKAPEGKEFDRWVSGDGMAIINAQNETASFKMPAGNVVVTATFKDKQYTVTVNNGTGGGGYVQGEIVNITANPAPAGKEFDKWTGDGVTISNPDSNYTAFVMPARNVTVTATYKDKFYSVTVASGNGSGNYKQGGTVYISASAAPAGKEFDKWTVISGSVIFANPESAYTTFSMPESDVTVAATYKDKTYTATVNSGTGGGEYIQGEIVNITADPAPAGKEFDKWTGDGVTISNPENPSAAFLMPTKNVIVNANYKDKLYSVTVSGGTGGGAYKAGDIVLISVEDIPEGSEFDRWTSSDGIVISNAQSESASFTMPSKNVSVIATLKGKLYTVTVTGGSGGGKYNEGSAVFLMADPAPTGKEFDKWNSDSAVISNNESENTSFFMPAKNVIVNALYKDKLYDVTVSRGSGSGRYKAGDTVWLSAEKAPEGQVFDRWVSGDGTSIINAQSEYASFKMPANSIVVTATYKDKAYTVTVNNGTGGGERVHGEIVGITANPAPAGKRFDKWTSDGATISNPENESTVFLMPAKNVIINATYTDMRYDVTVTSGNGSGTYKQGGTVYISASAAPAGKEFDKWTVISGSVIFANPENMYTTFAMPGGDVIIAATYKDKTYTVTVGSGTGGGEYRQGDIVVLTANSAASGKEFYKWTTTTGDIELSGVDSEITSFVMPAKNVIVNATYKDKLYAVTVSGGNGSGAYKQGDTVPISVGGVPEGSEFDRWTSSDGIVISNAQSESASFTMPSKNVSVIATFKGKLYTATVTGGSGGGKYNEGSAVFLMADPAPEGKEFDRWAASGVVIDSAQSEYASFAMPARDVNVTAVYRDKLYSAAVSNGTGSGDYKQGAIVQVTADPAPAGKEFDRWVTGGDVVITNPQSESISFKMPASDVFVGAVYVDKRYTVNVSNGSGGGKYAEDETVFIAANAAPTGKEFDKWTVSGIVLDDVASEYASFTMPAKDVSINALFKDKVFNAEISNGTGSGDYKQGAAVRIKANPAQEGMTFDKWAIGDGVKLTDAQSEETSFIMPSQNVIVSAVYKGRSFATIVSGGTGSGAYKAGDIVTITANTALSGKTFERWSSANDSVEFADETAATTTFIMPTSVVTVTAVYKDVLFNAAVTNGTGGGDYKQGADVQIKANPAPEGMTFDKWVTSDGVKLTDAQSEETSFIMPSQNVIISAVYKGRSFSAIISGGTGGGAYKAGDIVTITASQTSGGKTFERWSSTNDSIEFADENAATTTFVMPTSAVTVTAVYKDVLFNAAITNGTGSGDYKQGAAVQIKANPTPEGMAFEKWAYSDGVKLTDAQSEETSFIMPSQNVIVSAVYKGRNFSAIISGGTGGGAYKAGDIVTITASQTSGGKTFERWSSTNDSIEFADETAATTTFIMPTSVVTITAVYKDVLYNAAVTNGTGSGNYKPDEIVWITADPAPKNKIFDKWATSGGVSISNPQSETASFKMPANDVVVNAVYKDILYTLTVHNGSGGGSFKAGARLLLIPASPPTGKVFDRWVVSDGVVIDNPKTEHPIITMPSRDAAVVAVYKNASSGNDESDRSMTDDEISDMLKESIGKSAEESNKLLAEILEAVTKPDAAKPNYGNIHDNPLTGR